MATSPSNEVKAPQHFKTPRSYHHHVDEEVVILRHRADDDLRIFPRHASLDINLDHLFHFSFGVVTEFPVLPRALPPGIFI
jgi:hypothetical protein